MATFTFAVSPTAGDGHGTIMGDFVRFGDYENILLSGTRITLTEGQDGTGLIFGTGFTVGINGPVVTYPAGTITGLRLTEAGSTFVNITGLKISLKSFTEFMASGDDTGLNDLILSGNDLITGTNLIDALTGAAGHDDIRALGGNDQLYGGEGKDSLFGGDGSDTLLGGVGADSLLGGNGNDSLLGDNGADRLFGGGGNDILIGIAGNDYCAGGAGNDLIWGSFGADTIFGNAGNDTLVSHSGVHALTGGAGADIFGFINLDDGDDIGTVFDFVSGVDKIALDPVIFRLGTGTLANAAFRMGNAAQDADDRIIYHKATGKLYYDADGIGGTAQIEFANLGGATLRASDIFGLNLD